MEDSSLNQAHFETRKAERLTRQGKLDAAIEAHEKASDLLTAAMTLTNLNAVQQSLLCQKEYHIRQVWLLQSKIAKLDKYIKKKMNSGGEELTKDSTVSSVGSQQESQQKMKVTQMEIMRTLSEADTALHLHADSCTSMDPHLNLVIECLNKIKQQLEDLFHFSRESDTATDLQIEGAIQPIMEDDAQSSKSFTPEEDKRSFDLDVELPALAPLEVPLFDFNKFDD